MSRINLGRAEVELDAYASQANAVLGIRGAGKTYSATYIAERLLDAGIPITVLDPIGMWRFLRVPGAGKGYPVVVAGGEHGDIPLPPHGAAEIVRAAMRDGVSIVFDLYDAALSKRQWRDIVEAVVKTMLYENKAHGLRHVFIEEAAEFVPQRIRPDQGAVYDVVERLARMGGNAQLGLTLINQRAEEVNKAVLDLCDLLILHRQKGRNSLINLGKWMDVASVTNAANIKETVPGLKNGEAFIWPAESDSPTRTKIPEKHSYHPDRKAMHKAIAAEAKRVDVGVFVATMKGSLERLMKEAEQNDPKLLRAEIARLKREIAQKPAAAPQKIEIKEIPAIAPNIIKRLDGAFTKLEKLSTESVALDKALMEHGRRFSEAWGTVNDVCQATAQALRAVAAGRAPPTALIKPIRRAQAEPAVTSVEVKRQAYTSGDESLGGGGLRRMLIALAQRPQGLTKGALGVRAGLSSKSGTFSTYLAKGRSSGWMNGDGRSVRITDAGIAALGSYDPLPTGSALLDHWLGELGRSGAARILKVVAENYPNPISKEKAAAAADLSGNSGSFSTYLARLRTLELVSGRGELVASDELFD